MCGFLFLCLLKKGGKSETQQHVCVWLTAGYIGDASPESLQTQAQAYVFATTRRLSMCTKMIDVVPHALLYKTHMRVEEMMTRRACARVRWQSCFDEEGERRGRTQIEAKAQKEVKPKFLMTAQKSLQTREPRHHAFRGQGRAASLCRNCAASRFEVRRQSPHVR